MQLRARPRFHRLNIAPHAAPVEKFSIRDHQVEARDIH